VHGERPSSSATGSRGRRRPAHGRIALDPHPRAPSGRPWRQQPARSSPASMTSMGSSHSSGSA
jgi:hypothetical protein